MKRATAHNTVNNDAPSFDVDYSCRSIAFGARELIVHNAKSNGVVCAHVRRQPAADVQHIYRGSSMRITFVALLFLSVVVFLACDRSPLLSSGPITLNPNPTVVLFADSARARSQTWELIFHFGKPGDSQNASSIRAVLLTTDNLRDSLQSVKFDRRGEAIVCLLGNTTLQGGSTYKAVELTASSSFTVKSIHGGPR